VQKRLLRICVPLAGLGFTSPRQSVPTLFNASFRPEGLIPDKFSARSADKVRKYSGRESFNRNFIGCGSAHTYLRLRGFRDNGAQGSSVSLSGIDGISGSPE